MASDGPDLAEVEEQSERSGALLLDTGVGPNAVFDRCPLDDLAHLDVLSAEEGQEWNPRAAFVAQIERAMQALDPSVFVPLLRPDETAARIEYPGCGAGSMGAWSRC